MEKILWLVFTTMLAPACKSGGGNLDGGPDGGPVEFCYNVRPYTRGEVSNFPLYPKSAAQEPAAGQCLSDPHYHTTLCKAVDKKEFSSAEIERVIRPVYSRWSAVNSDGTLYFLVKDGETPASSGRGQMVIRKTADDSLYRIVSEASSDESAEFRWDMSGQRPTLLYYREECALRSYDASTGQTALVHDFAVDFPNCGRILNDVEGDADATSRYFAFMVQDPYDGENFPMRAIVTYDRAQDRLLGTLDLARYRALGGTGELPRPNMVDMSPLGTKVVALFGRTDRNDAFDGPHAFDLDFSNPVKVCNDESHSGWAFGAGGEELFVCQVTNNNWPNAPADTLAATDIRSGQTTVVLFHEDLGWDVGGFHFGRFYDPSIRGWFFLSTYSEYKTSQSFLRNQLVMVEVKPFEQHPRIWRIGDTHNNYPGPDGYPREAYSPISPDGRIVLWGADWPGGDGTVDTYRVDLPARWWEAIETGPICP
ncbi:MAG: hypothetical protein GYA21_19785 [Myxococcales bacterium]|nr:hypothetical protein [Myxococcales bacterium]